MIDFEAIFKIADCVLFLVNLLNSPLIPHNFHVHSKFSDGNLSPEKLTQLAQEQGVMYLGITDHFGTHKLKPHMQITNLAQYITNLRELQAQVESPTFHLKVGLEIDCSLSTGVDPTLWDFDLINQLDYVLLEYVQEDSFWEGRPLDEICASVIPRLKIPRGLAHNHVIHNFKLQTREQYQTFADQLHKNQLFLELNEGEFESNQSGGRYYFEHIPEPLISILKTTGVQFSIGTDVPAGPELNHYSKAA